MKTLLGRAGLIALAIAGFVGMAFAGQTIQISDSPSHIEILQQDNAGLNLRVTIGEIEFIPVTTEKGDFVLPQVSGFSRSQRVGEPAVPMVNRLLSIPYGCELSAEVVRVTEEEISLGDYGITAPLMPVQPSLSKSQQPEDVPFEFNDAIYATRGYYELSRTETTVKGFMRGIRIGMVSVAPVAYNPTENSIKVCREMEIRVTFQNPDWATTETKLAQYYSPFFEPIYNRLINYQGLEDAKDTLTRYPIKYVIVSARMFEAQLAPFIEWKTKKGFNVVTAYTDVIGSSATAVNSYLEGLYNAGTPEDPAPSFVLFVGDAAQIQPFNEGAHVTDMRLCEFNGDDFPEILHGRFSAQNAAQLQPQIDKTLEYEKYELPDPSYLGDVVMIAGVDGSYAPTYGNGQINYGTQQYFNEAHGIYSHTWLYPASNGAGVNMDIIDAINDGVSFANYTAHCGHTEWSSPNITTSNINNNFANYHKYLLGVGNCCLSNTFAESSSPCFGEVWMQVVDKGGIGYIGGTNSTYWDEDYWWGVGYGPVVGAGPTYEQTGLGAYDGVFHDHGEPVEDQYVTNDAIIYCGNMAVSESGSSRETYYWEIYCLMGDPSVMTYLGVPEVNNASYPDALLMTETSITVNADPGSYIGISVEGVLHGAGYVDVSGTAIIPLTEFAGPGIADIVISAQNKQPYISTIQVITPNGPYMVYNDDVVDDAAGNGNGLIDYGESIVLGMELKNVGPDMAYGVTATLSTSDSYVTITDATENYGDIAGDNATAYISDAFAFDVAPSVPDGHRITFLATMTDDNDSTWTSTFKLTVHAPVLAYVTLSIDDGLGNNNGVMDPGETVDFIVTIQNTGSGQADDVVATLSESDAYVSIGDDAGDFGQIPSGETSENGTNVFIASADAGCPRGHEVTFQMDLSAINGFSAMVQFTVVIGDRVVFFSDDFSFNQGWSGLSSSGGEWTIGPATGGAGSDSYGGSDPALDHSPGGDNGVLGNDLTPGTGGDYSASLSSTYWVTSPPLDCGDFNGVQLYFQRWLGVERNSYDHASLQVFNGSSWQTIFENGSENIDDGEWLEQMYDVSAYADSNNAFQLRFGIGSSDGSMQYCGWNIDDLYLKGYGERTSAEMAVDAETVIDSLIPGDEMIDTVMVYNLSIEAILRVSFSSDVSWMSCSGDQCLLDPETSMAFPFTLTTAGLAPGDYVGHLMYVCNDYSHQYDTVEVLMHLFAPDISISMTSIEETMSGGDQSTHDITIDNIGPGRLEFTVGCQMFNKNDIFAKATAPREPIGERSADGDKSMATEPFYAPTEKSFGGPDGFGYLWTDSDEPGGPTFAWVDISGVGTPVSLGDDATAGPFAIGFDFPYYENAYNEVYIGSNGIITFGEGSGSRINTALPTATVPNNMIAMWWDDLDPGEGGNIYYYYDAVEGQFIISFVAIQNYISGGGTGSLNFQAILKANGQILLQYATMDPGEDTDGLLGATLGIENASGADGLEVCYNAAYMHDNLAISFKASRWMSVSPASGTIEPYSSGMVTVTLDATELEQGVFTGQVVVMSNDPETAQWPIPVSVTVESFVCGDANGDGDLNVADAVHLINYVFKGGAAPDPLDAGDANGDGDVNVADAVYLINFVFSGGPGPIC